MRYTLELKPLERVIVSQLNDDIKSILIQIQDQVTRIDNYTSKYKEVLRSLTGRYVKNLECHALYGSFPCKENELYATADWSKLEWQLNNRKIKQVEEVREDGFVHTDTGIAIEIDGFTIVYHNHTTTVVVHDNIKDFLSKERSY